MILKSTELSQQSKEVSKALCQKESFQLFFTHTLLYVSQPVI